MVVNVVLNNDARTYKNEKGKLLKCPLCEKGFVVTNIQYNFRNKLDYKTSFYCKFCRENNPEYKKLLKKAREEGSFRSFGASNIFKTEEGQKLAKEGMIKKYGNYNPTLVSSLKEKQLKGKQRLLPSGKTVAQEASEKAHKTMLLSGIELSGAVPKQKSIETCRKKYGADTYFGSLAGSMTLDAFIKRHGEKKGTILWENCNKNKAVTLTKMKEKWGEKEGLKKYNEWKNKIKQNKENFIKRWGKEEGLKKYNEWVKNFLKRTRKSSVSKASNQFFKQLKSKLPPSAKIVKEHVVKNFKIDAYINYKNKKFAVKYNGTFWHCDPRFYEKNEKIKFKNKNYLTVGEIWEKDEKRKKIIEDEGYIVIEIWEYDATKNPLKEIEKILGVMNDFTK